MSDYTISIPDSLYQKAQEIAKLRSQDVDDVIREGLAGAFGKGQLDIPDDEQAELKAMSYLSDDALWTIARETMPSKVDQRISELLTKNQRGTISAAEREELEVLVERGDKLTLRKSQAMRYLSERGYTINPDDLSPTDE